MIRALLLAVLPATAQAAEGPMPPVYPPPADGLYLVRGQLSNYVPATAPANGSITIHITSAGGPADFAVGSTLTFPVTPATRIVSDRNGQIRNGATGQVRILSTIRIDTLAALQTHAATSVQVDRERNVPGRTLGP